MAQFPSRPSPSKLRDAFVADLTSVWAYAKHRFSGDQPYALILYGTEGGTAELHPQVLTEAGLAKVAQRYVDKKIYETVDEGIKALRYSTTDSPWFRDFVDRLPTVKGLCAPFSEQMYEDEGYKLLAKGAVEAFRVLDDQGMFGRDAEREKMLLAVVIEDIGVDYSLKTAKAANPPSVFERYKKHNQPESPYESVGSMSIAPDGKTLFAERSRANPKGKPGGPNEFIQEFVAYTVNGSILKQRWVFDLTPYKASGRVVRCSPDGSCVVGLASRYDQDARRHLLLRLDTLTGDLLHQFAGIGEPASLALSPDGKQTVVGTHGGTVLLYDAAFQLRHKIDTQLGNQGLLFLRTTGELLVGGRWSFLILDPAAGQIKDAVDLPGFRLSANADESVLLASRWFDANTSFDPSAKKAPFGVGLVSLPDCRLIREIQLPEKQLVLATLSPDGRHFAAKASPLEGYIRHGVVVDCETGQSVLDQRLQPSDIAFFPDNRRVAFSTSNPGQGPPVNILEIPGRA
ncbi:MAG TPA: DUF4303 domain-containing protein [Tepidisphaeraceae bacterium]|nr:DUF4303 domain-containing protein [Tepidisphaeraceae bacterium]